MGGDARRLAFCKRPDASVSSLMSSRVSSILAARISMETGRNALKRRSERCWNGFATAFVTGSRNRLRLMLEQWPKLGLRGTNSEYDFTSSKVSLLLADRKRWKRQHDYRGCMSDVSNAVELCVGPWSTFSAAPKSCGRCPRSCFHTSDFHVT